eukprot:44788-Pelagomonas_calceolata.AAC.2
MGAAIMALQAAVSIYEALGGFGSSIYAPARLAVRRLQTGYWKFKPSGNPREINGFGPEAQAKSGRVKPDSLVYPVGYDPK